MLLGIHQAWGNPVSVTELTFLNSSRNGTVHLNSSVTFMNSLVDAVNSIKALIGHIDAAARIIETEVKVTNINTMVDIVTKGLSTFQLFIIPSLQTLFRRTIIATTGCCTIESKAALVAAVKGIATTLCKDIQDIAHDSIIIRHGSEINGIQLVIRQALQSSKTVFL